MINFYALIKKDKVINPNFEKHGITIPFRALIAAPSGAGKTNCLMNLLVQFDKTFHEIILCCKSSDEPLYQMLENKCDNVIIYDDKVPDLKEYSIEDPKTHKIKRKDKLQRLIIFDDMVNDIKANQIIKQYYIKGRKVSFSMIYISQSFFQIPKIIRENCQYFILCRNLLKKDLRMILSCFPSELSIDQFSNLYNSLFKNWNDCLMIDINNKLIKYNISDQIYKL